MLKDDPDKTWRWSVNSDTDYKPFVKAWSTMIELQAGKALTDRALELCFDLLADYELFEVKSALRVHCLQSAFIAKPADVVAIITGTVPSNAELYGLAMSGDTILGAYVRMKIGSFDIDRLSARDATARVSSARKLVEGFVKRAQVGEFTDDEIRLIGGKKLDVTDELCEGLPGARLQFHSQLRDRNRALVKVQIGNQRKEEPRTDEETENGKAKLAEIMKSLNTETVTDLDSRRKLYGEKTA